MKNKCILIVEDNLEQLSRYGHLGRDLGLKVYAVSTFEDGKAILNNSQIDYLLADIHLSSTLTFDNFEGLELISYARDHYPSVIPIAMTSDPKIDTYKKAKSAGAIAFLKKPVISSEELELLIREASNQRVISRADNTKALDQEVVIDQRTRDMCQKLASLPEVTTVIYGESGTGKEEIAKLIHRNREAVENRRIPFVPANCAYLGNSSTMINSILFGHSKGSFTGADKATDGLIRQANDGILFLDEIHALPIDTQRLLLRVLNDGSYQRLGDAKTQYSNFQVIVASTTDLDDLVDSGDFLVDLRGRLTGIDLELKPLRERKSDIPKLLTLFFQKLGASISDDEMSLLVEKCSSLYWQGNIRQLFKAVQTLVSLAMLDGEPIIASNLPISKSMYEPGTKHAATSFSPQFSELSEYLNRVNDPGADCQLKKAVEILEKSLIGIVIQKSKSLGDAVEILGTNRSSFDIKRKKYDLP